MNQGPFGLEAGVWAGRLVEGYADRAQPEMSEGARTVLLEHLARHLGPVVADAPIGDWPAVANAALDAWEDEARTQGPWVQAFDDVVGVVRFRASR